MKIRTDDGCLGLMVEMADQIYERLFVMVIMKVSTRFWFHIVGRIGWCGELQVVGDPVFGMSYRTIS